MEIIVDNQIVKLLVSDPAKILNHPLLFNVDNRLSFRWPSLLEYLDLGSVLSNLPAFKLGEPLFDACIVTLCANEDVEVLLHFYDRLFTECLNQIVALDQLNPSFLLQTIKVQRQKITFLEIKALLSPILDTYEMLFSERTSHTRHDLVLYLAWDRLCVWMARLFDHQSTDPKFLKGIRVLKECLIESYQHITQQGRTKPSLYRMLEAFVFYQMREENLETLTDSQWQVLSQSFQTLKEQDVLADYFYIDDGALTRDLNGEENSTCYLTLDSPKRVQARLALAHYMTHHLKAEVPNWAYALQPQNIVHLEL